MFDDDFDFDHAWTLCGTLHTQHADALQTLILQHLAMESMTDERYAHIAADPAHQSLSVDIRHDNPHISIKALALACIAAAPDLTGTLTYTRPYTELQEQDWPVNWTFRGPHGVFYVPQVFQPADPQWGWTPDGTRLPSVLTAFAQASSAPDQPQ
jgi:hypothetical protein